MKKFARRSLAQITFLLAGLCLLALFMAWSMAHPSRAAMLVDGKTFSLGTTTGENYRRHSWEVRNRGLVPLKLRTRFTSGRCGFSLWLGEDYFVPAEGRLIVSITVPTPSRPGTPFAAYADVLTDDPETPRYRFRVVGVTGLPSIPDRPGSTASPDLIDARPVVPSGPRL